MKHYDYDPIGTWGKLRPKGPQTVNHKIAAHLPKRQFGRREPSVMQWEKLICDV